MSQKNIPRDLLVGRSLDSFTVQNKQINKKEFTILR